MLGIGAGLLVAALFWKGSRVSAAAPGRLPPAVEKAVGLGPR
jgi:hypothetical protein